mmetsp:Transcript_43249/g.43945  ORF Transcript_43249/g.43945 Transcript_43249/m.43945 type:complete len:382 (-) Transcript_43249:259-1404(-)
MPNYNIDEINSFPIANAVALPVPAETVAPHPDVIKNDTQRTSLQSQGYTLGLIESIKRSNDVFPLRIWVIDNSGSMSTADGHRLHQYSNNAVKILDCTRWAEIQDTVRYHAQMTALLEAPTSFRLLNPTYGKEMFSIAERGPEHIQEDLRVALDTMYEVSPSGCTPLSERVREIGVTVESMKDQLFSKGHKVAIVLATDGLPTDRYGHSSSNTRFEFKQALRLLEGLPLWVVIRLCTDDDEVVDFYNNIDNELELSIDVLDDFVAEAKEVYEHNKWLNYALPLHRMREMGFYHKLFDLIDERSLTRDELINFFYLLYGADVLDSLPDPQVDWDRFLDRIAQVTRSQNLQWNPIFKKMMPWVDIRKLDHKFGNRPTCFPFFR